MLENPTKIVLLVLDGLGDLPHPAHGGTHAARGGAHAEPRRARAALPRWAGCCRWLPGITPGSGPGHLALFGYDPVETPVGRGVLEALGAGMELRAATSRRAPTSAPSTRRAS